jgi:hypothetical protein
MLKSLASDLKSMGEKLQMGWFVATGAPRNAHLVMVYTNFRYVLA